LLLSLSDGLEIIIYIKSILLSYSYKNKNPADGPANAPIPPRPPDKTGNPTAASNKKITLLSLSDGLEIIIYIKSILLSYSL
jgi:hypothetical protein